MLPFFYLDFQKKREFGFFFILFFQLSLYLQDILLNTFFSAVSGFVFENQRLEKSREKDVNMQWDLCYKAVEL